ncbi:MAG: phosphoserine phosphatase [Ignavibacteria bacterium]|nr:MAG: phosphoserine phosphatase [Ignavibacteria bacterium]KAF0160391.1 MAG: phosphoserine phosphatase [Ignavibacteria bacterium]
MDKKVFKVFVDFDGTITKKDVGEELFIEFGDREFSEKLIEDWNNDLVDPRTGWKVLCESVKHADEAKIKNFLNTIEIEKSFKRFVVYCKENNFELRIISDGFDYYIKTILDKEELAGIEFSSNVLLFNDNKMIPSFPNSADDCKCSANCKRNYVLKHSSDDDFTVYIGDGVSDRCPIQFCDFIFAKDSLLKFCEVNRITYFPYKDFDCVIKRLEEVKTKKRLKKRHQALLKRKEVYLQEA